MQFTFKYLKSQNEQVLSRTFSTKPHKNFNNQPFQEYSTEKVCSNKSLFIYNRYNGKALGAESSARGCFVKKKYFISERFLVKQIYWRIIFQEVAFQKSFWWSKSYWRIIFQEWLQEPLQNIRWSTFQQDLTACRR